MMQSQFWRGKRVLVTGHTGFKGSWLCIWLQQLGAEVVGFALSPPTRPSMFETARLDSLVSSIIGDVRDYKLVAQAINEFSPEIVIHLAAQSLLRRSYENAVETYGVNIMGTVHVLEAVRQASSVRVVVNVTSDKCYENREWEWGYRESDPMGGYDPYSSSKGCSELVTSAYRNSYFNPTEHSERCIALASARAGNVIGGGDWAADRLIPDLIRAFERKQPAVIRNPNAIRPWQHVLEPLAGYLLLAERLWVDGPRYSMAWNFGSGEDDARPVSWIADRIVTLWGDGASWTQDDGSRPHEAHQLRLDSSRARALLRWRPQWTLDEALGRTVAWFQEWKRGGDSLRITQEQIDAYVSDMANHEIIQ